MTLTPLVSVIIPTYNYAQFICQAIDSVLESNFPQDKIEIIVVDDGSTDDTSERVSIYGNRIKYIAQNNSGKAWATKVAIDCAEGKYLFNLDADDFFFPNKIKEVTNIFEEDESIIHVAHPAICWNVAKDTKIVEAVPTNIMGAKMSGRKLLSYFYKRRMLFGGGSTFAGRTEQLKNFSIPKQIDMFIDEYLVLFTLNQGNSFFIKKPLSTWRIHATNYSGINSESDRKVDKKDRSLASQKSVLESLRKSDLQEDIKKLYELNINVEILTQKEQIGKKSLTDVLSIWFFLLKFFRKEFMSDLVLIIKSYTLIQRSLPTQLFFLLKKINVQLRE